MAQCLPCDTCSKLLIVESLGTQMVKSLPAVQETRVRTLGWKALLEKQMATRPSMLAWETAWTEESGGLRSVGSQRVGRGRAANTSTLPVSRGGVAK